MMKTNDRYRNFKINISFVGLVLPQFHIYLLMLFLILFRWIKQEPPIKTVTDMSQLGQGVSLLSLLIN